MKKYLFTGFIALLPLALTLIIANWLFNLFTAPVAGLMESIIIAYEDHLHLSPERHADFGPLLKSCSLLNSPVGLKFILGVCGQKFLVQTLLKAPERLFSRIPACPHDFQTQQRPDKSGLFRR